MRNPTKVEYVKNNNGSMISGDSGIWLKISEQFFKTLLMSCSYNVQPEDCGDEKCTTIHEAHNPAFPDIKKVNYFDDHDTVHYFVRGFEVEMENDDQIKDYQLVY